MSQGWDDSSLPGTGPAVPQGVPSVADAIERPPTAWLIAGLAVAVIASGLGVAAIAGNSLLFGAAGWLLAGPVAIGLLAGFIVADGRRRQRAWYVPSPTAAWLRRALVVVALVGVVLAAWGIADVVARW